MWLVFPSRRHLCPSISPAPHTPTTRFPPNSSPRRCGSSFHHSAPERCAVLLHCDEGVDSEVGSGQGQAYIWCRSDGSTLSSNQRVGPCASLLHAAMRLLPACRHAPPSRMPPCASFPHAAMHLTPPPAPPSPSGGQSDGGLAALVYGHAAAGGHSLHGAGNRVCSTAGEVGEWEGCSTTRQMR